MSTGAAHSGRESGPGYLAGALGLIAAFMIAEVAIGLLAHSLALISDAVHMLTDAASIALAITAIRLSARPPTGGYTYGLRRTEILSAQANGITLLLLSVWLTYEAVRRLIHPPAVAGWPVLGTALAGIVINAAAAQLTARADRTSLNVEGAFKHIVTDAYAFIATAIAGIIMITTGFDRADAIASLVVVVLMAKAGGGLVRESGRIFLEAAPAGLSPETIGKAMASRGGVAEVHDLHVWTITSGMPAASAHVLVGPGLDCHAVRVDLERLLEDTYHIKHTTLQVDHAPQQLLSIGRSGPDCQAHEPHPAQTAGPEAGQRPAPRHTGDGSAADRADRPPSG
ncbi:MAG TPA: cation diffusion facilitator family transporter [Streptosporangiaceae bacterium]|jgi:cobalt-zinc-cadmium efflux system protein|nr:cation diffusion facilitator family transporter [Streptosporangiaceae bacterium]